MGISSPFVAGLLAKPSGDLADSVVSGTLTAVGPGAPYPVMGPFNVAIYGSVNTALTTSAGSLSASVVSGTGIAAGGAISSANVPAGTTWATFSGTSGTLALPAVTLPGIAYSGSKQILMMANGYTLASLVGATVTGPNIPAATTVASADSTTNLITLSAAPTASTPSKSPQFFSFALAAAAVAAGTDSKAIFTGASTTFSATVQVERSFDGGSTWVVCNSGGGGSLAQFTAGTPVSLSFGEPEKGMLYRVNCITYTSGTINYRISSSGAAAMSLGLNQLA